MPTSSPKLNHQPENTAVFAIPPVRCQLIWTAVLFSSKDSMRSKQIQRMLKEEPASFFLASSCSRSASDEHLSSTQQNDRSIYELLQEIRC